ncbi:MAG: hypothetical protein HOP19_14500 [Acidobacteria bacterium]|nr:hypothetical protein [Acidobacteriota bacterium]
MLKTKRWITILCAALLTISVTAPAQDAQRQTAAINTGAQEVLIIIQPQHVRFAAPPAMEQMHLQVTNPAGETVFDSGGVSVLEIFWPLHDANNAPLKSGLYAYRLTVKTAQDKEPRVQRGHFIVDRAQDRDGSDRLWVTSRNDNGVGAELTVAKQEDTTVAGTRTPGKNKKDKTANAAEEIVDGEAVRSLNGLTDHLKLTGGQNVSVTSEGDTVTINAQLGDGQAVKSVNGLTDQITLEAGPNITITPDGNKLTIAATGAGNSSLTEVNGNIGIGVANPLVKLHVSSSEILPLRAQSTSAASFAAGWDFYHGTTGKGYVGAPGSATSIAPGEMLVYAAPGTKTSLWAGGVRGLTVDTNGHVGIGTASPFGELHLHGYGPVITLSTTAGKRAYIQNVGGNMVFKPHGFGECCSAFTLKPYNGFAEFKGLAGPHEVQITSANDRAYLKLNSLLNGQRGTWSVESGIYGRPGWFGIYDWEAKRGRLAIDPTGLVYVDALRITGGADFAEHFDVNTSATASTSSIAAGMVVSIDAANPGKLALSHQAYDRRVAGIISGAGGVKPGMMMGQTGTLADGQHPVALSGRVYVWVDAARGAVNPGDLLTSSATPGHAMKAAHASRAQGAIIGKAMTGLKQGKGLVLVLVTLQ